MSTCCDGDIGGSEPLRGRQRSALIAALWINVVLFATEAGAGHWAGSSALISDALDNLGDVLIYAASLYVVYRTLRWRAGVALLKGGIQVAFGLGAIAYVAYRIGVGEAPISAVMIVVASVALAGNLVCFWLLTAYRRDDINMRSVWLCARNDCIGNVAVLAAAGLVVATGSHWPDVIAGAVIAAVFLKTGVGVLRESARTLREEARAAL